MFWPFAIPLPWILGMATVALSLSFGRGKAFSCHERNLTNSKTLTSWSCENISERTFRGFPPLSQWWDQCNIESQISFHEWVHGAYMYYHPVESKVSQFHWFGVTERRFQCSGSHSELAGNESSKTNTEYTNFHCGYWLAWTPIWTVCQQPSPKIFQQVTCRGPEAVTVCKGSPLPPFLMFLKMLVRSHYRRYLVPWIVFLPTGGRGGGGDGDIQFHITSCYASGPLTCPLDCGGWAPFGEMRSFFPEGIHQSALAFVACP